MPGVFTGENGAYNSLDSHETVNHGDGEYVRGEGPHTTGQNRFWASVRRGYNGTFHRIEPKHLHRYVNEFAGRLSDAAAGAPRKDGQRCTEHGRQKTSPTGS